MNKIKLAVFHAFFTQKGGGEKLIFDLRNNFNADLFAGAIHFKKYDPNSTDSFSQELFNTKYKLTYLHKDIDTLLLRLIKRFIFFGFSPKIKKLLEYEAIIFSGNVMFVQRRIKKLRDKFSADAKPKLIIYCHTPPRNLTDQFESFINSAPKGLKTAYKLGGKFILREYIKDIKQADFVITNSQNTHRRLLDYTGIDSTVIYPAVNTEKFKFISQQEFFLSYARLENMKRIPLLMEAFSRMPEKKLVICSTGPLHSWVADQIRKKNLTNISFKGLVTDEILVELVGNCL
ncbi:MAG: glycosyltransferase, partial [Bacteroidota bacterium]